MTSAIDPAAAKRRAAVGFVFVTVTLDIVANGVIGPVWPMLVKGMLGGDTSRSALIFGVFATVFAAAQLLAAPVLGALSDTIGRRPVILVSCFGLALDYVIMALAPNLGWLFVGRVLAGITSASMATASAYVADVTPPEERAGAFGMLSAAFGIGFILGPTLGGLIGQFGARLPFWAAAGLTLANAAWGLLVLPESLPKASRARFSFKLANPVGALAMFSGKPQLLGLALTNFITRFVHAVFGTVWALYVVARYGWGPGMIGVSMGVVGVASLVVSMGLVKPTVARLGERWTMALGLGLGGLGFILMGVAPQGWAFLASIGVLCLWGLAGPAIQSLMTREVSPSEQGRLQGANSGLTSIAGLIGPGVFASTLAFAAAPAHGGGAVLGLPFHLAGALMFLAVAVGWRAATSRQAAAIQSVG